jgi:hypothetical protein
MIQAFQALITFLKTGALLIARHIRDNCIGLCNAESYLAEQIQ